MQPKINNKLNKIQKEGGGPSCKRKNKKTGASDSGAEIFKETERSQESLVETGGKAVLNMPKGILHHVGGALGAG